MNKYFKNAYKTYLETKHIFSHSIRDDADWGYRLCLKSLYRTEAQERYGLDEADRRERRVFELLGIGGV
jgi:hypothetical protein